MIGWGHTWWMAAVVALLLFADEPAAADSWTVTQKATIGSPTILAQGDNQGSTQAINAIMLGDGGTVVKATQTVEVAGGLTLSQAGGSGSRQAGNLVEAGTITEALQTLSAGATTIVQTTAGDDNWQALNMANATGGGGGIGSIGQTATVESLNFALAGGEGNRQAGNLVTGSSAGSSITQTLTCSGTVTYADNYVIAGVNNLQAGNAVFGGTNVASVTQAFTANGVEVTAPPEIDGANNIKAANYLETGHGSPDP
ncbi:hypothetical protein Despr_0108 [Desulfobulbus propionicus DSM 2032]|uniref:Uncharacterized protein n=1 Tax=Desulfobulbus propionicus (strain ATCC 33891 / DSM 2032 / VKM B-1956 / 1pr3) TaxID=577650 RepID=A0A7U4DMV9_DESPD|nr:hypothetical protein [Desulfobulbus propionicus]ADW16302.1 hypothetical protein Despr_0108 [Desulfobulbus propionicus DSM 2032]